MSKYEYEYKRYHVLNKIDGIHGHSGPSILGGDEFVQPRTSKQLLHNFNMSAAWVEMCKTNQDQDIQPDQAYVDSETFQKSQELELQQEMEYMKELFTVDMQDVDYIYDSWNLQREKQVKIEDIVLDVNFIYNNEHRDVAPQIRKLRCHLCLGLVKVPGVNCTSCHMAFCRSCLEKFGGSRCPYGKCTSNQLFTKALTADQEDYLFDEVFFAQCQDCGVEPEEGFTYDEYLEHLLQKCEKIKVQCPFGCDSNTKFEKYELKTHLVEQNCQKFPVICMTCRKRVEVKDRLEHGCSLLKLYQRAKEKLIHLKICTQICKTCHSEMLVSDCHKAGQQRYVIAGSSANDTGKEKISENQLCTTCKNSGLVSRFDNWKASLTQYYRATFKGVIISPWHHYQMRILEDDMIEMDSAQYEQMYKSKIEFLRGQHLQQKRYQEEESVLDSTITEC